MNAKEKILDAAERIVLRDGVAHLTMDAVAAEAKLSKGGVLYNFPSKDELIRGMIHRHMDASEAEIREYASQDPDPVGRFNRAHLMLAFNVPPDECARLRLLCTALLAAVVNNPALLEPLNQRIDDVHRALLDDGIDPVMATILRLAADGFWMAGVFGFPDLPAEVREQVLEKLKTFTRKEP